jgi:SAM-dependent methyltransferase
MATGTAEWTPRRRRVSLSSHEAFRWIGVMTLFMNRQRGQEKSFTLHGEESVPINPPFSGGEHYDENYFKWQKSAAEFGGWANLTKFERYVRPDFNVIDFGCGAGYLLRNLECKAKIGIDINDAARAAAAAHGLEVHRTSSTVPNTWADLIISDNALEHCLRPLDELEQLLHKVKPGGRLVFVLPCESVSQSYAPGDINRHLYSWSPLSAGNLFDQAGFIVTESKPYIHKWPPGYQRIRRYGGRSLFEIACRISGRLRRSWFQVRVVAERRS